MGLKFKVKVPGTSANIGVGYDCLGVALDYFLELEVEESDKIEFLENGKPFSIPIEENLIFEAIKYTEKHLVKNIPSYKVNIVKKQYSDKICNFVDSQNEKLLFNDDILTVDDDYTTIVNDFILFLESISKYNKENLLNLLEKKNEVSVLAGYELLKRKEIDKKYYIDVYSRLKNSDMKKELQLIYEK